MLRELSNFYSVVVLCRMVGTGGIFEYGSRYKALTFTFGLEASFAYVTFFVSSDSSSAACWID